LFWRLFSGSKSVHQSILQSSRYDRKIRIHDQTFGVHVEKKHLERMLSENIPLQFFISGTNGRKVQSKRKTRRKGKIDISVSIINLVINALLCIFHNKVMIDME